MPFLAGYVTPQDYGAVADGVTDDTSAFQAALTATAGSALFVPAGTYKLTSALTVSSNTTVLGADMGATVLKQTTTATNCVTGSSVSNVVMSNLTLQGPNDNTGTGLALTSAVNCNVTNVISTLTNTGFSLTTCTSVGLNDCESNSDVIGVLISGGTANVLSGVIITANESIGVHAVSTAKNVTLIGVVETSPAGTTSFITVDSGCSAVLVNCFTTTGNTLASGTTTVVPGSSDTFQVPVASTFTGAAAFNNTVTTAASIDSTRAAGTNSTMTGKVTGDTVVRYNLTAGGAQELGPGGATARDTFTGRATTGTWYTSPTLLVGATTALGDNGVGEIQLHNATTAPTSPPTAGTVIFSQTANAIPLMGYTPNGSKYSIIDAVAIAASDQTFTTTSQVASTQLTLAVEISATYLVEAGVIFSNATSGNTVFSWSGPASATFKWNDTGTSSDYQSTIGGTNSYVFSSGVTRLAFFKGKLIVAGTSGNFALTVSNSVGGTSTSTVLTDSWLRLTRVK